MAEPARVDGEGEDEARVPAARKGIQSVNTGFRIIDFLIRCERPVPLREIARGTGLSPSAAHVYLVSLVEIGVALQDARTGHYGLGPYTMRLGLAGLQQFDIFTASRTPMADLARRFGFSVLLGVWGNLGPTIVHRCDGQASRAIFDMRIGTVLPVLRSSLGRLFLALLPPALTERVVRDEMADIAARAAAGADIGELPPDQPALAALLEPIRQHGYSRCRGGLLADHVAISAPVFDHTGTVITGLTIIGESGLLDDAADAEPVQALRAVAAAISDDAGRRTTTYLPFVA